MRKAVRRHLDDATLLRLAARELRGKEALEARKHFEDCAKCRNGHAAARGMDRSLTRLAEALRSDDSGADSVPDSRYFDFVGRLLGGSEGAEEAAERILRPPESSGPTSSPPRSARWMASLTVASRSCTRHGRRSRSSLRIRPAQGRLPIFLAEAATEASATPDFVPRPPRSARRSRRKRLF